MDQIKLNVFASSCAVCSSQLETYLMLCVSNLHVTAYMRGRLKYKPPPLLWLFLLSAGGERCAVRVRERRGGISPVQDWERPPDIQSEARGVQRHTLPEGNKEISAGQLLKQTWLTSGLRIPFRPVSLSFHLGRAFVRSPYLCFVHCSYLLTRVTQTWSIWPHPLLILAWSVLLSFKKILFF